MMLISCQMVKELRLIHFFSSLAGLSFRVSINCRMVVSLFCDWENCDPGHVQLTTQREQIDILNRKLLDHVSYFTDNLSHFYQLF